jgi:transposase
VQVTCGIDWAEDHHDIALVAADGTVVAQRRIGNDAAGFAELLAVLAEHDTPSGEHGDQAEGEGGGALVPVAIETSRGLLVAYLQATGRDVYAINPLAAARYRERYRVSGAKSDTLDAIVLANILRTDRHAHRALPRDSEQARAVAVLARAQQHAVWDRVQVHNQLRQLLADFYPAALAAFAGTGRATLDSPAARTILAAAPTPQHARALTVERLGALLVQAGRQRGINREARRLHTILTAPQPCQPPLIEQAMGHHLLAVLRHLDVVCGNVADLTQAAEAAFAAHPDAKIITSFPGVGLLTGARLLAELGDDRARFADAKALKAYAGTAPITRASGRRALVSARRARNDWLVAAGYMWTVTAIRCSPGARTHYDRRRAAGDSHSAAQRNLLNRLLGKLHHCLQTSMAYDEARAFATSLPAA